MSAQHNDHPTHQNFLSDDVAGKCHTHTHTHTQTAGHLISLTQSVVAICMGLVTAVSKDQTATNQIQQRSDS